MRGAIRRRDLSSLRLAVVALVAGCLACGSREPVDQSRRAALAEVATLGFESPTTWTVHGATATSTDVRTEGSAALALHPSGERIVLTSGPVPSTAASLAGMGVAGTKLLLDVRVDDPAPRCREDEDDDEDSGRPARGRAGGSDRRRSGQARDTTAEERDHERCRPALGVLHVSLACPSLGLERTSLGRIDLGDLRPGLFQTVKLAVPDAVRTRLAEAPCADLSFRISIRVPEGFKGSYLIDNLRTRALAAPLPPASQTIDLDASLSYQPPISTPSESTFVVAAVQVPHDFHLQLGRAGQGQASLEFGLGGTTTTCTYSATADGSGYALSACAGRLQAGDLVSADRLRLTILAGDPAAGVSRIRAQLATNPAGDALGAGVIPPLPTFWGDTVQSASAIATQFFEAVPSSAPDVETWILAPVGDFARRRGNGAPGTRATARALEPLAVSMVPVAAAPFRQPFEQGGSMNPGGSWDAGWQLDGGLDYGAPGEGWADLAVALSARAVVLGQEVTIARLEAGAHTDWGGAWPVAPRLTSPVLGGVELPLARIEYATPPIQIWIFSIQPSVWAEPEVTSGGVLTPGRLEAYQVAPGLAVGAGIYGGVSIGVASGGVDADVSLLGVSTPVRADVAYSSGTCLASRSASLHGEATVDSLGGRVDLVATLGYCPFCKHKRWTIFDWDPLASQTTVLFDTPPDVASVSVPCCTPVCDGRCGGPDSCGGSCPDRCASPDTCGGGGVPNVCGSPPDRCGDGIDNDHNGICDDGCYIHVYQVALDAGIHDIMLTTDPTEGGGTVMFDFFTYRTPIPGVTTDWQLLRCYGKGVHFVEVDAAYCESLGAVVEARYGYPLLESAGPAAQSSWSICYSDACGKGEMDEWLFPGPSCDNMTSKCPGGGWHPWTTWDVHFKIPASECWGG
jgi:hypothetical protein